MGLIFSIIGEWVIKGNEFGGFVGNGVVSFRKKL